eukprot:scaffold2305_cov145-Skeletonema_menzelii.AAC.9
MKSKVIAILAPLLVRSLAPRVNTCLAQDNVVRYRGGGGGGRGGGGRGGRGRGRGGGGGGKGKDIVEQAFKANCYWGEDDSSPLVSRINEKCGGYDCDGFSECLEWETLEGGILIEGCDDDMSEEDAADLKDTINKALKEKREKFRGMSAEERAEYREQKEKVRQRNAENVMKCGCCSDNPEFELGELVGQIEGAVAKTLDFSIPKGEDTHDGSHGVSRLQAMVDAKCPAYILSCPNETIDLSLGTECVLEKPHVDWSGLSPEERDEWKEQKNAFKEQVLKCSCCTGTSVAELFGDETSSKQEVTFSESREETKPDADGWLGLATGDRPSSAKVQLTIHLPNRPYMPHRRREHDLF